MDGVMHRLFVALRPPENIREVLLDTMEGMPVMRWQDDDQLHLTLRFVGEVERPVAEDLATELGRVRFERFSLALQGVGRFEKHNHGALWAGIQPKDQVKTLAAKVERACQSVGLAPERRAYHPHITLARWKGRTPGIDRFIKQNANLASKPWEVGDFILYESRLGHEGAYYEAVESYQLG